MKISILLPYKENFSPKYPGAVSIFVKDTTLCSKYYKNITIFGYTKYKSKLLKNYINLDIKNKLLQSNNKLYVKEFLKHERKLHSNLIEVHNRPSYILRLLKKKINSKLVLIFHNNPLNLGGSKTVEERNTLVNKCEKLIFVSNWVKEKFFEGLDRKNNNNCIVIYPSIETLKKLPVKENIISFVGKLNHSKGFHLFGNVIVKILNKYKNWKGIVVGDEPREKYNFKHKNLKYVGWISHEKTLELYNLTSISVAPSFWEEPFGRTSMEAASRGCATIISKKGDLIETIPNALYLADLTAKNLFNKIEYLIKNKKERINLQKKSYQNVLHKLEINSKKIDAYRNEILYTINFPTIRKNNYKIIHISNFGNRLFNRLYFISIAKKISNGLIRLGHDVINISDRDTIRFNRNISGKSGINYLNKLFVETVRNYSPDLIVLGHSDNLQAESLEKIKNLKKDIKIIQWFEDNLHKSGPDPILNQRRLLKYEDFIDHNFITTHPSALKFIKNKKKYSYLPIPVDKNVEKLNIYQNNQTIYDLFFTMSHGVNRGVLKANKYDERYPFIEKLLKKNPNILFDIYGYKTREPDWSEDFYHTINLSKMGLNLSRTNSVKYYTSNRISSLIGNGLMTFVDIKTQLNDFFDDDEVVFYKNVDDLSEKLNYFKENDSSRKKIARKGQEKYFRYFNSELITKYMLSKVFGFNLANKKKWMDS